MLDTLFGKIESGRPRYYARCADCLSIGAVEAGAWIAGAACGVCGGPVENMGRVERDRLVRDEMRTPCDGRCTNARGPRCDCKCGGQFHGSGMLIRCSTDAGRAPRLHFQHEARALAIVGEYRQALQALQAEYRRLVDKRYAGAGLQSTEFVRMVRLRDVIRRARASRSHAARMRLLASAGEHRQGLAAGSEAMLCHD